MRLGIKIGRKIPVETHKAKATKTREDSIAFSKNESLTKKDFFALISDGTPLEGFAKEEAVKFRLDQQNLNITIHTNTENSSIQFNGEPLSTNRTLLDLGKIHRLKIGDLDFIVHVEVLQ